MQLLTTGKIIEFSAGDPSDELHCRTIDVRKDHCGEVSAV